MKIPSSFATPECKMLVSLIGSTASHSSHPGSYQICVQFLWRRNLSYFTWGRNRGWLFAEHSSVTSNWEIHNSIFWFSIISCFQSYIFLLKTVIFCFLPFQVSSSRLALSSSALLYHLPLLLLSFFPELLNSLFHWCWPPIPFLILSFFFKNSNFYSYFNEISRESR